MIATILCAAMSGLHVLYKAICGSRNKVRTDGEITQDQLFAHIMV